MPNKYPQKGTPEHAAFRKRVNSYEREWNSRNMSRRIAANKRQAARAIERYEKIKASVCCVFCRESLQECIDFHHLNPLGKEASIGDVARDYGLKRLMEEIMKCVSLCKNCHVKVHVGVLVISEQQVRLFTEMIQAGMAELVYAPHP